MFEKILNDAYIMSLYKEVELQESISGTARHDLAHVTNVITMTENVLNLLNMDVAYLEAAKIAALLHDIGVSNGKKGHAEKSYELAKQYFVDGKIDFPYKEEALKAIKNHSDGFEQDSLMGLVLIFSDKLDITELRLTPEGRTTSGVRQLQFINKIDIIITEKLLTVNFLATEDLNIDELNTFSFVKKVFQAVNSLAAFLNKDALIQINKENWNYK